jgi:uncharacterized membrane protein
MNPKIPNQDFKQSDRIYPLTRVVAAFVVPFLVVAFIILYFTPDQTGVRFAWPIKPHMTSLFMGAGYLGGAYFFIQVVFGRRWHRISVGFLPVATFTLFMLLSTIFHWDLFNRDQLPFKVWIALYIITPLLVPWVWLRNREVETGEPERDDVSIPLIARWGLGLLGVAFSAVTLVAFLDPQIIIDIWPWTLSPLTANIMGGWSSLLGVGGILISRRKRWSAWKDDLESIAIWFGLVLLACLINPQDFNNGSLVNWFVIGLIIILLGMVILYVNMEFQRLKQPR